MKMLMQGGCGKCRDFPHGSAFLASLQSLPADAQALAHEKYQLWARDPFYPSMMFKPLGKDVWSVRIGDHYRALGKRSGDLIVWFWIGTHEEYNRFRF